MIPLLRPGEYVLVNTRIAPEADLAVGDLALARHPYVRDLQILKQVSEITPEGRFVLRGTNSLESTDSASFGALSADQILGRVTCRLHIL
jgi:hypothetical protein